MRPPRLFSVAARVAAMAPLAVALWSSDDPARSGGDAVILVDRSASVSGTAGEAANALRDRAVASLPPDSHATVLDFAGQPGDAASLATATDIEAALRTALGRVSPGRPAAVLLISDGGETEGQARRPMELARQLGIPVYAADPRDAVSRDDAWISAFAVPEATREGDLVPVALSLGSVSETTVTLQMLVDGSAILERAVDLDGKVARHVTLSLPAGPAGLRRLSARLIRQDDALPGNNAMEAVVAVAGRYAALVVGDAPGDLAASLRAGGWTVAETAASGMSRMLSGNDGVDVVVLNDVDVSMAPLSAWTALDDAVRRRGVGLLVLGGPRSFAAGGYRRSLLEALLPVTAESGQPTGRLAVLFVIDKSGSMAAGDDEAGRMAFALRTVTGTAELLEPGDLSGLMWFDREVRWALPLGTHADLAQRLSTPWEISPSGGTALSPALAAAAEALAGVDVEQRLAVVVTDGAIGPDEDMEAVRARLIEGDIGLVTVVVGGRQDSGLLQRLSEATGGALLEASGVAAVPHLVRREIERERNAFHGGASSVRQLAPLPFAAATGLWPPTAGHAVTRPRGDARVYLESGEGDPLLVLGSAGLGSTAALPADLAAWTAGSGDGARLAALVGGLVRHLAAPVASERASVSLNDAGGGLSLIVDAAGESGSWSAGGEVRAVMGSALSGPRAVPMRETAPGRWEGSIHGLPPGTYTARADIDGRSVRRSAVLTTAPDHRAALATRGWVERGAAEGLLRPWRPDGPPMTFSAVRTQPVKAIHLMAALAFYLLTLGAEWLWRRR